MKTTTNRAALPVAFNHKNLKSTADYFRANWKKLPAWRLNLGKKCCRDAQPVVKAVAKEFSLTPLQARSVVIAAALRHMLGLAFEE